MPFIDDIEKLCAIANIIIYVTYIILYNYCTFISNFYNDINNIKNK